MAKQDITLFTLQCILKSLKDLQSTTSVDILGTLENVEALLGVSNTSNTFSQVKFVLRNNAGTLQQSFDNSTWATFTGSAIPANVKSFYILNMGDNNIAGTIAFDQDISLTINGQNSVMLAREEVYKETVQDEKNNLAGNIVVTPAIGYYVTIGYKI